MIWQRPTSWSAETVDGRWYAEKVEPSGWTVSLLRGRAPRPHAHVATLKAAKEFAESAEASRAASEAHKAALERLAKR
jgi:hypothetical protein